MNGPGAYQQYKLLGAKMQLVSIEQQGWLAVYVHLKAKINSISQIGEPKLTRTILDVTQKFWKNRFEVLLSEEHLK